MKEIFFFFFVLTAFRGFAQDIHWSQYNASPLNLNPALTGFFDGDFRFTGNERTQWGSVTNAYRTISGSFDARVLGSPAKTGMLSAGLILNSDKAGDAQMGLFQGTGSLAYTHRLDAEHHQYISLGFQAGYSQKSINTGKLVFDDQYDYDAGTATQPTQEVFSNPGTSYFDFSSGINYSYSPGKRFRTNVGFGLFHLTEPQIGSFRSSSADKLYKKFVFHGNVAFNIGENTQLIPSLLVEKQHTFTELLYGTNIRFGLDTKSGFNNAFYLGVHNRRKDALVFLTGMEYQRWNVALSYDVNTSTLKPASHYRGGLELSVIYIIKKVPALIGPKKPCPTFM